MGDYGRVTVYCVDCRTYWVTLRRNKSTKNKLCDDCLRKRDLIKGQIKRDTKVKNTAKIKRMRKPK